MITVGLDFGTHQTKICVEDADGYETHYSFYKFPDENGQMQFTLPSIIAITPDEHIKYGYVGKAKDCKVYRYFKQAVYQKLDSRNITLWEAARFSIWYLAYILFDLEEKYGRDISIQMGVPSDSEGIEFKRQIGVTLIASAYNLVEDEFENDKQAFLDATYSELVERTNIIKYSDKIKRRCAVLAFPESYACLLPLVKSGRLSNGLSLVVDIGGGTTDISMFTIENKEDDPNESYPQIYFYFSINKGLNFLTDADNSTHSNVVEMRQFFSDGNLNPEKRSLYFKEICRICSEVRGQVERDFCNQTKLYKGILNQAWKNRPVVYTGGGSALETLRSTYQDFIDIKIIDYGSWKKKNFDDQSFFEDMSLCPVLSTAYGLSIHVKDDSIKPTPLEDLFAKIRKTKDDEDWERFSEFDYGLSYDALK